MKKVLAMTLAACLALSMAACGGSSSSTAASSTAAASSSGTASSSAAVSASASASSASSSASGYQTMEDLIGKKVGVQLGTTGDTYASDTVENGGFGEENVERYSKGADAVNALLTGKIDAVVIDNGPAEAFVAANADKLRLLDTPYTEENYAICIKKGNSDLTTAFNGAIAELKKDGTLDKILDKYINGTAGATGYVTPEGTKYPNGTLTMATNAYFPPYEYYADGSSEVTGIDAEFAKAICDKLGYELKIEDMEFDSIIPAVQSGKADFGAAGMTVNEDRLKNVDFTDSYCTGIQSIIVLK